MSTMDERKECLASIVALRQWSAAVGFPSWMTDIESVETYPTSCVHDEFPLTSERDYSGLRYQLGKPHWKRGVSIEETIANTKDELKETFRNAILQSMDESDV